VREPVLAAEVSAVARRWPSLSVIATLVVMIVAAVAFAMTAENYQISLVNYALIASLGAMALNVVMGLAGLVTVGNAALLGIGAFSSTYLALDLGLPFLAVVLLAGLVGAVVGIVIGFPALRVHGIYLAIVTLALHFIVVYLLTEYQVRRVGAEGFLMPFAEIGNLRIRTNLDWYILLVGVTAATFLGIHNLKRGKYGRAWLLIHYHPLVALTQGISLGRYRLLAFVFSSWIIATAGALLAYFQQVVYVETFTLELTIQYIAMIIIGGLGSPGGAIAGAFFVVLLPTFLGRLVDVLPPEWAVTTFLNQNLGDVQLIIYGSCVVVVLVLEPRGLAGVGQRLTSRLRKLGGSPAAQEA
jgi:branched-chain amino acid transport system permease protein